MSRENSSLIHLRRKPSFKRKVKIQHQTVVLLYNLKYSTWVGYFIVLFHFPAWKEFKDSKSNCMNIVKYEMYHSSIVLKYTLLRNSIKFAWYCSLGYCIGNMQICILSIHDNAGNSKAQPYKLICLAYFHWHVKKNFGY